MRLIDAKSFENDLLKLREAILFLCGEGSRQITVVDAVITAIQERPTVEDEEEHRISDTDMVEYLLRDYARYELKRQVTAERMWKLEATRQSGCKHGVKQVICRRFGMQIRETDTEYIAYNDVREIHAKKLGLKKEG